MDDRPKFFITDVFGERRYSGNQLATFLNCRALSDREMQQIAREINFSETTFVLSDEQHDGGYDVRIFTPEAEIDFAGHPTLGTAYIIQKHIIQQPVEKVVLNLKVGQVPVEFSAEQATDDMLWMQQVAPTFGEVLDVGIIAQVLSLNEDDIDSRWPIEQVSTGLPHIIVPLKSLDALKRTNVIAEFYWKLVNQSWAKIILVFCPEGYTKQHELGVRVFPIWYGITEDPATGSGNGCLAAFLVKNRYFQSDSIDIVVGQGYEIGRPSLLSLRARQVDGHIGVIVGGRVIPIAEGRWG
jgi:trans-2,3-dihydro-3-hydroxyanthranilate isomerase